MAEITQIQVNDVQYNIKDANAVHVSETPVNNNSVLTGNKDGSIGWKQNISDSNNSSLSISSGWFRIAESGTDYLSGIYHIRLAPQGSSPAGVLIFSVNYLNNSGVTSNSIKILGYTHSYMKKPIDKIRVVYEAVNSGKLYLDIHTSSTTPLITFVNKLSSFDAELVSYKKVEDEIANNFTYEINDSEVDINSLTSTVNILKGRGFKNINKISEPAMAPSLSACLSDVSNLKNFDVVDFENPNYPAYSGLAFSADDGYSPIALSFLGYRETAGTFSDFDFLFVDSDCNFYKLTTASGKVTSFSKILSLNTLATKVAALEKNSKNLFIKPSEYPGGEFDYPILSDCLSNVRGFGTGMNSKTIQSDMEQYRGYRFKGDNENPLYLGFIGMTTENSNDMTAFSFMDGEGVIYILEADTNMVASFKIKE